MDPFIEQPINGRLGAQGRLTIETVKVIVSILLSHTAPIRVRA